MENLQYGYNKTKDAAVAANQKLSDMGVYKKTGEVISSAGTFLGALWSKASAAPNSAPQPSLE